MLGQISVALWPCVLAHKHHSVWGGPIKRVPSENYPSTRTVHCGSEGTVLQNPGLCGGLHSHFYKCASFNLNLNLCGVQINLILKKRDMGTG